MHLIFGETLGQVIITETVTGQVSLLGVPKYPVLFESY